MAKILHFQDQRTIVDTPDWRDMLYMLQYEPAEVKQFDGYQFEIFKRSNDWALYHPPIAGLEVEVVYAYVPSREQVEELLDLATQMIGPLTQLSQVREMFDRSDDSTTQEPDTNDNEPNDFGISPRG